MDNTDLCVYTGVCFVANSSILYTMSTLKLELFLSAQEADVMVFFCTF